MPSVGWVAGDVLFELTWAEGKAFITVMTQGKPVAVARFSPEQLGLFAQMCMDTANRSREDHPNA